MTRLILIFALSQLLSGCAAMEASKARDTESLLAAAGFRIKLADTPEKQAHTQELAQHQLVAHPKDGAVYYVYADATTCHCVYWGNEDAYQRYQQLAVQKQIADEQQSAAMMNQSAAMNWGMWGMGPWYYY